MVFVTCLAWGKFTITGNCDACHRKAIQKPRGKTNGPLLWSTAFSPEHCLSSPNVAVTDLLYYWKQICIQNP